MLDALPKTRIRALAIVVTFLGVGLGWGLAPSFSEAPSILPTPFPAHTYYQATRLDPRLCPSPMCGGVFVKKVNRRGFHCPDGSVAEECLANLVNWSLLGLDPEAEAKLNAEFIAKRVVVRGELALDDSAIGTPFPLTVLFVREAWRGVTGNKPRRRFYGVVPTGIVCVTFPCPGFLGNLLNRPRPFVVHDLDLTTSGASEEQITEGLAALENGGLIVSGHRKRFVGPAGKGRRLVAKEFYTRVRAEPRACGGFTFPPNPPCDAGEFCDPPPNTCFIADLPGTCTPVSDGCFEIYQPVCGCDGVTYSNDCFRLRAQVGLAHPGVCER